MYRPASHGDAGSLRKGIGLLILGLLALMAEWRQAAFGQAPPPGSIDERTFFELYDAGVAHADAGDAPEALRAWLEAFDRSRGVPGLEEARLTLPLDGILALAEGYEPAHKALIERRDAAERALVENQAFLEDAEEVVALNALLTGPDRSLAAYDRYRRRRDADPEIVAVLRDLLWSDLIAAGRYDELAQEAELRAGELIPLMDQAREAIQRYEEEAAAHEEAAGGEPADLLDDGPDSAGNENTGGMAVPAADAGEIWHEWGDDLDLVAEAIELYEVLIGSGRAKPAEALRKAVLRLEPEAEDALSEPEAARR